MPENSVETFFAGLSRRATSLEPVPLRGPFAPQSVASAIYAKIEDQTTLEQVAEIYADAINGLPAAERAAWEWINGAVEGRFGARGLEQVKRLAWKNISR